jgi:ribosomal-protein-alanine N-acetyltransferase
MKMSERIYVRLFTRADAANRLELQIKNRAFFERYAMTRDDGYYTLAAQEDLLTYLEEEAQQDRQYGFGIYKKENDELIGTISLFQIVRGSVQGAFIGYFLDEAHNGQGYMTEAVQLIVEYGFHELKLHRIEAGVMPHNIGSIRVLEKAGFHKEGLARKNVRINGKWEDHQMLAIINPND